MTGSAESLGVSTALFAHVQAAVEDAFPLDEVLAREGIDKDAWLEAQITVRQRVAGDVEARAEYEEALVAAQDRFARTIAPVEDDLGAWLALLDAVAAAPAPFSFLTKLKLRMSDLARLKRVWTRRTQEDESIDQRIAELRKHRLPPLPPLRVGAAEYVVLRGPPPPVAAPRVAVSIVDGIGLDAFALMNAELERSPLDADAILGRHGLDTARHAAIAATFRDSFEIDPSLQRDYLRLLTHASERLRAPRAAPPLPTAVVASAAAAAHARVLARKHDEEQRVDAAPRARGQGAPSEPTEAEPEMVRGGIVAEETADARAPAAKPLPFEPAVEPSPLAHGSGEPPPPHAPRGGEDDGDLDATAEVDPSRAAMGARVPVPFRVLGSVAPAASGSVRLTVEQYASLHAELAVARTPRHQLLARYSIPEAQWAALDASWRDRFAADEALRTRFQALLREFLQFLGAGDRS